jgi:Transglycosylase-like domain
MRLLLALSPLGLASALALTGAAGSADAGAAHVDAVSIRSMRADVDHYRTIAWTFQRVARESRTPTSFSYRRTTDDSYLHWTLDRWQRVADRSRRDALSRLHRLTHASLPRGPRPQAPITKGIAYNRRLTLRLRHIYPGRVSRGFAHARGRTSAKTLQLWQVRAARAALLVSRHPLEVHVVDPSDDLTAAFLCIHHFEGAWNANTGNGYYGGLQMDARFMHAYGPEYLARWGTADAWPPWAQVEAARRAYASGRGFEPWPNSARACGLR